jgi:hypothetical protein
MGEGPAHSTGQHPIPGVTEIMDAILDRYPEVLVQHVHTHREPHSAPQSAELPRDL